MTLNPVMVAYYREIGFLPAAVLNGLARLGWSLDDKTEYMSLPFIVENFTLDRIVKSPAGLDPDKLLAYQEHWMGELSTADKVPRCLPYLVQAGWVAEPVDEQTNQLVTRLIEALGDRLKLFSDVLRYDEYFVADEGLKYDEKAFEKRLVKPDDAAGLLRMFRDVLAETESFEAADLDRLLHDVGRAAGHRDRAGHSRPARGRHRQACRPGHVRLSGTVGATGAPSVESISLCNEWTSRTDS